MAAPDLHGSITALVTPFRDGAVDEPAFRRLVQRQIAAGTHGLVPCGTTGESVTLSPDEHRRVVEVCVEVSAGRAPVIAGAGSNDTRKTIELARVAQTAGADAALIVTPYYNKPSQAALVAHFAAVADACDLPLVLYDVPSRTGVTMSVETVAAIAERSTVVGIKDAVGDMVRPTLMRAACGPDFILLSGDDPSALGYMAHGGRGCISVTSNVAPEACAAFQNACLAADFAAARVQHEQLIDLHRALFFDASPAPAKYALNELGLCTDEVRRPLLPCAAHVRPQIGAAMRRAEVAA